MYDHQKMATGRKKGGPVHICPLLAFQGIEGNCSITRLASEAWRVSSCGRKDETGQVKTDRMGIGDGKRMAERGKDAVQIGFVNVIR
jgi:hypothetical protein